MLGVPKLFCQSNPFDLNIYLKILNNLNITEILSEYFYNLTQYQVHSSQEPTNTSFNTNIYVFNSLVLNVQTLRL